MITGIHATLPGGATFLEQKQTRMAAGLPGCAVAGAIPWGLQNLYISPNLDIPGRQPGILASLG